MRRRNGLIAWSVMGRLLSRVRVATPHLQTGRALDLSRPRNLPQRPTGRAVWSIGTKRALIFLAALSAFAPAVGHAYPRPDRASYPQAPPRLERAARGRCRCHHSYEAKFVATEKTLIMRCDLEAITIVTIWRFVG
jgi:hypothetical protein